MIVLAVGKILVAKFLLDLDAWLTTERNAILNAYLPGTSHLAYSGNAALYMSIHTADPGDTGAAEYTTYTGNRPSVTFNAAASQQATLVAQTDYAAMGVATITHVGLWDNATKGSGAFKGGGALGTSKTTGSGDTLRFPASTGVVVSLA